MVNSPLSRHGGGAPSPGPPAPSLQTKQGGPASAANAAPGRPECFMDLKLGGLGEFDAAADSRGIGKAPAASASVSPGAAKRPRASSDGSGAGQGQQQQQQCPSCAVDGCRADMSKCRDYHRRHKVCEAHSKTPVVTVAGREMRFCQQCSSF